MWALNRMAASPYSPPGSYRVPIYFQGQIVPGVEGELRFADGRVSMTIEHIIELDSFIKNRILSIPGVALQPGQSLRVAGHTDDSIEYEIYNLPQFPALSYLEIPPYNNEGWNNRRWNNRGWNNGEVRGPEVPNVPVNPYAGRPMGAAKAVPAGATNVVMGDLLESGEEMADFHGEAGHGRYYKKSTFNSLELKGVPRRKENPFTRQKIQPANVEFYTKAGGGARRKTKSKRKQQRRRKTARRHG